MPLPTEASSPLGIPLAPLALGLAGLIPFWGLALAVLMHSALGLDMGSVSLALVAYAAIIVSFLGGIRWGVAVCRGDTSWTPYALSVVPSLIAWAALALPTSGQLLMLGLVALVLGPIDLQLVRDRAAPAWFGRLRLILSTGAGAFSSPFWDRLGVRAGEDFDVAGLHERVEAWIVGRQPGIGDILAARRPLRRELCDPRAFPWRSIDPLAQGLVERDAAASVYPYHLTLPCVAR